MTSKIAKAVESNKELLATAALFETGRIANNKLAELVADKLPAPFNMFVQTPLGQLALANLLVLAGEHFRPGNELVTRITNAMVVQAYTGIIQSFNVEGIIDDLLGDKGVLAALNKAG